MRIAGIVYLCLVALAIVNLFLSFDMPMWLPPLWGATLAGIFAAVWLLSERENRMLHAFGACGLWTLIAIAIGFAVPAWEVINQGSSGSWTGRITPLLVIAIALYGAGLWIESAKSHGLDATTTIARIFTGPNLLMSFITAAVLCSCSLLALEWIGENAEAMQNVTHRFLTRGIIPPITVLLFFWGMLILAGKWFNALYFRSEMGKDSEPTTWRPIGIGRTIKEFESDGAKLDERMEYLWRRHEESFLMPRYINYVIPVIGFIGTVLGISLAADGITDMFAVEAGLTGLTTELGAAISPLGIAFDTTLIALSLGAVLLLILTLVQKREEHTLSGLERKLRESTNSHS